MGATVEPDCSTALRILARAAVLAAVLGTCVPGAAWAGLSGSLVASPAPACMSDIITVSMHVTNTGAKPVTNIVPSPELLVQGSGSAMPMGGPVPSMVYALEPGAQATFSWSYYAESPGTLDFLGSATGMDSGTVSTGSVTSGSVAITDPSGAGTIMTARAPEAATVGEWFRVIATIADTGGTGVSNLLPSIFPDTGAELVALMSGPTPAAPVDVTPGGQQAFTWTYSASGSGDVAFSISMAGNVCYTPVAGSTSVAVALGAGHAVPPAYELHAALVVSPGTVDVGGEAVITMTVMNTGTGDLENVAPSALVASGAGAATLSGPVPATVALLAPGKTATFAWRATTTAAGSIAWSGSALSAANDVAGAAIVSGVALSQSVRIVAPVARHPSRVEATASAAQGRISGLVDLTFRVLDDSGQPVPGTALAIQVMAGGGLVTPASSTTDGNGLVTARFRLGPFEGTNLVRGTAAGGNNPTTTLRVEGELPGIPTPYLSRNFFDPAKGESVQIQLMVPAPMRATAKIFDMSGELVRNVDNRDVPAGLTVWRWDGRNVHGEIVGNGMYFVQIASGGSVQVKRIIVLKRG